ncbi:MAG: DUF3800 domain-containing protein [Desulfosporosinus sp.]|nr:DUF3800 domain-containing protein [Desulfosporosinus sp.]
MEMSLFPKERFNDNKTYAFIDETGNYGFDFDKEGVSSHFIITAILVNDKDLVEVRKECNEIRNKYFQTGEMKSQSISKNDVKRFMILADVSKLQFNIFSIIIDKRKFREHSNIKTHKKTFFKFLNKLVHRELHLAYQNLELIRDEHGSKEFMDEFKNYIVKKYPLTLFGDYQFSFIDSKDDTLIQLADFIGGTISLGFEEHRKRQNYGNFMSIIKHKVTALKEWPQSYEDYVFNAESIQNPEFNESIAKYSLRLQNEFIRDNSSSPKSEIQDQVRFLRYLEFHMKYINSNKYVSTNEIITNFDSSGNKLNKHYLRTSIVAKIRDAGVLVASSSQGYKLPVSEKEIYDFINHSSTIIIPMLTRLRLCREGVSMATNNQLDILDKSEYKELKRYFELNK